ncbi:hypothetical protein L3Y34_009180 [Caenorhabditis briggsae]|uniref:Seven TM Receptor n=1 Tax=Caenorhabditis briggsae TaxID=6238 RepID=A0AAE9A547_CAEBR|nr:hypothetical protein L3Y34_009180 [Caenorhabditis briggsae]
MQIYGIIFLCSSVSISFFTMIYFGLKTYFAMKKFQETVSGPSKKMQAQLFYSLLIQTIIPLILIHLPTTVIYLSSCFGSAFPVYGELITITISMFPAIDPLPSLIIIKPYKQAIKGIFQKQLSPKSASVDPSNRGISNTTNRAVTF